MNNNEKSNNKYYWLIVGTAFAAPYILVPVLLINILKLSYNDLQAPVLRLFHCWIFLSIIEILWRLKKQKQIRKIPWFAFVGFPVILWPAIVDEMFNLMHYNRFHAQLILFIAGTIILIVFLIISRLSVEKPARLDKVIKLNLTRSNYKLERNQKVKRN